MAGALHQVGVSVSPVQVSTNIILVLSEASVILREAEPCSHLERKDKQTNSLREIHETPPLSVLGFAKPTGLSMYRTEYLEVQA